MFLFILIIINSVVFLWDYIRKHYGKWKDFHRLPGPPELPIIGTVENMFKNLDEVYEKDRENSKKYFPIYKFTSMNLKVVMILHPEDFEIILTDMHQITKSIVYDFLHQWLGTGLLTSTGNKWQQRRKILTPSFHFSILQEFVEIFNEGTQLLVEDIKKKSANGVVNIIPLITHFALSAINDTAMGTQLNVSEEEKQEYEKSVYKMSSLIAYRTTRPWLMFDFIFKLTPERKVQDKAISVLHSFTRKVIEDREKKFRQDQGQQNPVKETYTGRKRLAMLDLLLKAKHSGETIDIDGIQEEVDTFMFEGHDTTATAISYILMLIANHPDVQKNVKQNLKYLLKAKHSGETIDIDGIQEVDTFMFEEEIFREINEVLGDNNTQPTYKELQDLKYTERCIKESLRLYPSVPIISRVLSVDMKTATGYHLPQGCIVNLMIYDLHHSPHIYENPEKFDPDRFLPENIQKRHPFAYLPFSAGPRNCIGQKFAMLELKAVVCGILKNFRMEAVDKPQDVKITLDIVLRTKSEVKIKFIPRH